MSAFDEAFRLILRFEGGYVNDPDDPGGETKWGISERAYPNLDIKNLTTEKAKEIYFHDYWIKANCPEIENYSRKLSIIHFVTAVNVGIKTANKILQKSLNVQGFNLKVDGIIGDATLTALHKCTISVLIRDYILELISYYVSICNKNPRLRKFLRGWINRALEVLGWA